MKNNEKPQKDVKKSPIVIKDLGSVKAKGEEAQSLLPSSTLMCCW
jgi:hypothetical protein